MHPAIPCRWLRKLCSPQRRGGASELSLLETRLPAHCARLEQKRPACKEQGRLWNQQQWRCQVSSRPSCFPWERCICIAGHSRVRKRQVDSMGMEQQGVQHCEWDRRVAFQREHQRSIWASIPNATRKSHQVHPRERTTSFAHSWGGQENSDSRWPVPVRGRVHLWFVDTGKDGMIALPHWFSMPIECCIALWWTEQQNWEEKKMARHPKPLTPSQQKLYDAWVDNSTRRLVLDQAQRCQITHPSSAAGDILWNMVSCWKLVQVWSNTSFFCGKPVNFS